jgi:hypothetical protein
MTMTEAMMKWMTLGGLVAAIATWTLLGRFSDGRRRDWFASIAEAFGGKVVREGEFWWWFSTEIDGHPVKVTHRHRKRLGWHTELAIPLSGISEIYNVRIQRKGETFNALNLGFKPHDGWFEPVVPSLHRFAQRAPLDVEGGHLIDRGSDQLDASALRDRATRLLDVARAIEQSLR